jgi:uncharacterized protein (DUF4415 family)
MNAKKRSIMSDLKRIDELKDEDIDYSDIPELDDSFFTRETVQLPKIKDVVTLRVDHEVLDWFKKRGKGYQTLMNAVLKAYVKAHLLKKRAHG